MKMMVVITIMMLIQSWRLSNLLKKNAKTFTTTKLNKFKNDCAIPNNFHSKKAYNTNVHKF